MIWNRNKIKTKLSQLRKLKLWYVRRKNAVASCLTFHYYINIQLRLLDISLLIGCSSNYAGDGPVTRTDSLQLNGFKIARIMLKYHISEINAELLRYIFSNNNINIGDEVVQLNNLYCEHIGNVTKYIESTIIHNIQIRSSINGCIYVLTSRDRVQMSNRDEIMQPSAVAMYSTPRRKRKSMNCKCVPIF